MASGTAIIPASQSTYTISDNPNYTPSLGTILYSRASYIADGYISLYIPFIGFDFGPYSTKAIRKAILKFYVAQDSDNSTLTTLRLYAINSSWDEKTLTHNTSDDLKYPLTSLGISFDINKNFNSGYKFEYDISRMPKENWNLLQNYGFFIDYTFAHIPFVLRLGSSRHLNLYPRIEIEWEDIGIVCTQNSPLNGMYQNPRNPITFSWSISGISLPGTNITSPTIAQSKFRWRYQGDTSYTEITLSAPGTEVTATYTMPANTLQAQKTVEWQVLVKSDENVWSTNTDWETFTTDAGTIVATPASPANTYVDQSAANTFTWTCTSSTNTAPSKSELQYTTNNIDWYPLATVNGTALSTVIPAGTLPIGNLYWRVRSYNLDGIAGNWSAGAAIVVQGEIPKPHILSLDPYSRTYAFVGTLYKPLQIQIRQGNQVIIDTGELFKLDYSRWLSPEYLPNGSYTFAIRQQAPNGQWSEWVTRDYQVQMPAMETPQVTYSNGKGFVKIHVENFYNYTWVYLLRDGVKIARLTTPDYIDWTAGTRQQYQVQGLYEFFGYADSMAETVPCLIPRGCILSKVSYLSDLLELYVRRSEPVSFGQTTAYTGALMHFAGREYPVIEFSTFADETVEIALTARTQEEWQKIKALVGQRETILYRDRYGERLFGVAMGIQSSRDPVARDYNLTLQRVDYVEAVDYMTIQEILEWENEEGTRMRI